MDIDIDANTKATKPKGDTDGKVKTPGMKADIDVDDKGPHMLNLDLVGMVKEMLILMQRPRPHLLNVTLMWMVKVPTCPSLVLVAKEKQMQMPN